jgi:hypothetical protein
MREIELGRAPAGNGYAAIQNGNLSSSFEFDSSTKKGASRSTTQSIIRFPFSAVAACG